MPFYEYRCEFCGEMVEALQKISDPPLVDCPACGKPGLKKQISAAGFRLKGGGWYETDFKSSGKRNLHDSGKSDGGSQKNDGGKAADKAKSTESSSSSGSSGSNSKPQNSGTKVSGSKSSDS